MSAILAALQLMVAAQGATAPAPAAVPSRVPLVAEAPTPPGFLQFCVVHPAECGGADTSDALERLNAVPVLSPYWQNVFARPSASFDLRRLGHARTRRSEINRIEEGEISAEASQDVAVRGEGIELLRRVNRDINSRIAPISDDQAFGVLDYWTLPLDDGARPQGDCEDFVLQKRSSLRRSGVALGAMSVAIVETPRRETHAVLLVNTDEGVLVLDNLNSRVRRLSQTPYRIISRETFGEPLRWKSGYQPDQTSIRL